ncbi:MAG: hypothetical protein HY509_02055 [Acidobacteria bacterium]|nr:hypothetical protein [Acidobacteriota bacterium]
MADQFLTLREAAGRAGRSAGTLRRYIKAGRLPAEKHPGKFGVEYRLRAEDLEPLTVGRTALPDRVEAGSLPGALADLLDRFVPLSLYTALVERHEDLLVELGMLRAGRARLPGEVPAELPAVVERKDREIRELRERAEDDLDQMRRHLRSTEREVEEKEAEIVLLRDRLNRLEQSLLEDPDPALAASRGRVPLAGNGAPSDRVRRTLHRLQQFLEVCRREAVREA